MTKKLLKVVFFCALAVGMASIAGATPSCTGFNVTVGGSCISANDLTYTFTNLTYTPNETASLTVAEDTVSGSDDTLLFQISAALPVDVLLDYTVTGRGIEGIDASYGSSTSATGSITETACGVAFGTGGTCSDVLSTIFDTTPGVVVKGTPAEFAPVSTVYITKDVEDQMPNVFSEFSDSIVTPEPMTLSLMGMGLLGIGLFGRRSRRSK
ncbi:MAG TPA: PEP-CTERM sorting domain-containing protein [Bryobacteraceae bacterium]|nr:PEP-CTERM sorting domain-containing protein [Bryobacteraceae bacterium]